MSIPLPVFYTLLCIVNSAVTIRADADPESTLMEFPPAASVEAHVLGGGNLVSKVLSMSVHCVSYLRLFPPDRIGYPTIGHGT